METLLKSFCTSSTIISVFNARFLWKRKFEITGTSCLWAKRPSGHRTNTTKVSNNNSRFSHYTVQRYLEYLSTGSTLTAAQLFQLPAPQSGTLSRITYGTRPSVQTVSHGCLKRTRSLNTSAFSALLTITTLYKFTYLLTSTCISRHPQLKTGGFSQSNIWLPACPR